MTNPLHIMVDMDGTICDWNEHYEAMLTKHFPHLKFSLGADNRNWDLTHGLDEESIAAVKFVMDMPGFYANLKPIAGAVEALREMLADGHHVTICSSPWLSNPTCLQDKVDWLNKHVGEDWGNRAVFTQDKTTVCGDVLIDDRPHIPGLESDPTWRHILFDQPYNSEVDKPRIKDWSQWRKVILGRPMVVGFGGLMTAGKDVVADRLVEAHGWAKLNMSDPLADALFVLNPEVYVPAGFFAPKGVYRYQALIGEVGYVATKTIPEVRRLLQVLGTEVGRQMIDENVWVDIAIRKIEALTAQGKSVAITGIRYLNERDMLNVLGGRGVWVERPGLEVKQGHASESSLSSADFDMVLFNDGTVEDLLLKVDDQVKKWSTIQV
jgi:5'-nucleotidase